MTILSHLARLFDELFGAVDTLVSSLTPSREEHLMTHDAQDLEALAKLALVKVKKNDYCGFGRNLTDKILKQFIVAQGENKVTWKDGTGCFKVDLDICITPVEPPASPFGAVMYAGKCLRVCVDGECVEVC
jgi:hypothetical protein